MTEIETVLAEHACVMLCNAFHVYTDNFEHDRVLDLWAEGGIFYHQQVGTLEGRDAIKAYLDCKSTYPLTRHLVSNVTIDMIDADNAEGTCYITVFYSEPTSVPAPLEPPIALVTYKDTFRRTADGWRFATRRPRLTHTAPTFTLLINTKEDEKRMRRS